MRPTIKKGARRATSLALAGLLTLGAASAALADDDLWDDALDTQWDGNTLNVPWDGSDEYETIAGDKFTHDAVAVPGDWIHRTLVVHNNGPCPGWLTVEVLNPNASSGDDTVNDDDTSITSPQAGFAGMSELHWDVDGVIGSSP
ncbi:MAG: hypothetical protein LBK95_19630, partial [Bifidobacteriaceae bacterium]|nr:hypothetical protein [Bifidobacteriaceae bacterium]